MFLVTLIIIFIIDFPEASGAISDQRDFYREIAGGEAVVRGRSNALTTQPPPPSNTETYSSPNVLLFDRIGSDPQIVGCASQLMCGSRLVRVILFDIDRENNQLATA